MPPSDNEWKDRVIDALVVGWGYKAEHEDNPKLAVDDLMAQEVQYALDPRISQSASDLRDTYKQRWRDMRQEFRDYLHSDVCGHRCCNRCVELTSEILTERDED